MSANKPAKNQTEPGEISRRDFVRHCSLGALALASVPMLGFQSASPHKASSQTGPASRTLSLDRDWLFGGKCMEGADQPGFNDAAFSRITLPHCVTKLSWQNWEHTDWEAVWIYRRHFRLAEDFQHRRV